MNSKTPQELFDSYSYLSIATLYRLLGQPHKVALSKSLEYDDLLQYAHIGLWKACTTYKNNKSNFETHAINNIRWSVMDGLNRETELIKYDANNMPEDEDRYKLIGYDTPAKQDDYNSMNVSETVTDDYSLEDEIVNKSTVKYLLNFLTERERKILLFKLEGKTDREIGSKLGVTNQAVNKAFHRCKDKLKHKRKDVFS